jgi:hypothetical protein
LKKADFALDHPNKANASMVVVIRMLFERPSFATRHQRFLELTVVTGWLKTRMVSNRQHAAADIACVSQEQTAL